MDRNLVEAKRAQVESIVQNLLTQVSAWTKVVSCGEHVRCIYLTQLHAITSVPMKLVPTYMITLVPIAYLKKVLPKKWLVIRQTRLESTEPHW